MDRLLTTKDAARITGLSPSWFEKKRWAGGGPPYVKFCRAVRYKESDLLAWIQRHSGWRSTSDPNQERATEPKLAIARERV